MILYSKLVNISKVTGPGEKTLEYSLLVSAAHSKNNDMAGSRWVLRAWPPLSPLTLGLS